MLPYVSIEEGELNKPAVTLPLEMKAALPTGKMQDPESDSKLAKQT